MSAFQFRQARRCVQGGGVIAYPTEAVYGLGCDPLNFEAVQRLLHIKQRPISKGLILIASHFQQLRPYLIEPETSLLQQALDSWPGPYTWLFPARAQTPHWLTGTHDSIAVRVTAHPIASRLCDELGTALVSTSANVNQRPPARSALECRLRCPGYDCLLPGAVDRQSSPSTIRDIISGETLRAGGSTTK
ncbi:MAG: Sua5/YciO/YrdC/YwlC family protein [Chromatiales bacterium]|jgi:L-threonylcarbamoyladenylate synthase